MIQLNNLSIAPYPNEEAETFTTLFENTSLKIEAIRSWLKNPGELYNQDRDEWVLLVEGEAELEIEDQILKLCKGDYLLIPKYTSHRVRSTAKDTLWLGIFSS
ncbi:MAG: cupin domain-containing protein [Sulfuricurvum sp.]|uniref:cupin domain-containing protein n=1 Tax=Sulfuricurvum sp. TaxID=2025608 RepID=UPI0025DB43B0|nr:cupin domain-containing protein [Sulfuricurvum sp.]MCI4406948.1 cupin domain-containing protein [Sulfuricurvum sp.]